MDELNTPMVMPPEESIPDWYDGKRINEVLFCQQFLKKHPMKCVRGRLFTVDGLIEDEAQIGNLILEEISGCLTSGLSKVVANLLAQRSGTQCKAYPNRSTEAQRKRASVLFCFIGLLPLLGGMESILCAANAG